MADNNNYKVVTTVEIFNAKGACLTTDIDMREFVHQDNAVTWRDNLLRIINTIYRIR